MYKDEELWLATMRYMREASGKLYENQIWDFIDEYKAAHPHIADGVPFDGNVKIFLENGAKITEEISDEIVREDNCGAIYTNPSVRVKYDQKIHAMQNDYRYNRDLYKNRMEKTSSFCYNMGSDDLYQNKVLGIKEDRCYINFTNLVSGDYEIAVTDFDLEVYLRKALVKRSSSVKFEDLKIAGFQVDGIVFSGNTRMCFSGKPEKTPLFINGMSFKNCTFEGTVTVQNLRFYFEAPRYLSTGCPDIDFKNCRFWEEAAFRDCVISGDSADREISFEDARFCSADPQKGILGFFNVNFSDMKLNCFQTVFGKYIVRKETLLEGSGTEADMEEKADPDCRLSIKNSCFGEKAKIICDAMQMKEGEILLENILYLPETSMRLEKGISRDQEKHVTGNIKLSVKNVSVYNPVVLSNLRMVFFCKVRNYSQIIADADWTETEFTDEDLLSKRDRKRIQGVSNKLTCSAYCYVLEEMKKKKQADIGKEFYDMAADMFNLFRINFQQQGLYDEEDEAFILYMNFRALFLSSRINHKGKRECNYLKKAGYSMLNWIGLYGLSPQRIILTMAGLIFVFAALFWGIGTDAVSGSLGQGALISGNLPRQLQNFLTALLYSVSCMIPYPSPWEADTGMVSLLSAAESFCGLFLIGYLSFSVVKRTLRG